MRLVLRCDASRTIGVGHAMRCLAVAEAALAAGHDVVLAGELTAPAWVDRLWQDTGVTPTPPPAWPLLARFASEIGGDAVWVDHYDGPAGLRAECAAAGVVLANVEDGTAGRRPADLVIGPGPALEVTGDLTAESTTLRGAEYALLRADVRRARRRRANSDRSVDEDLRVVVVLGGTDPTGAMPTALATLARAQRRLPASRLRVQAAGVVAGDGPDGLDVAPLPPSAVLDAMVDADLVVSAAGTTALELCAIGVPAALVAVAPNQVPGVAGLADGGLCFLLSEPGATGLSDHAEDTLVEALTSTARRAAMAALALRAVDGAGPARVLHAIEDVVGGTAETRTRPVQARAATDGDSDQLLEWRNSSLARRASRSTAEVSGPDHARWLAGVLAHDSRHLLVVDDDAALAVGSVRWDAVDRSRTQWEVSIALAPYRLRRGWGPLALAAAERSLLTAEPQADSAVAAVREENESSVRLFTESGYRVASGDEPGWRRFVKQLR